MIDDPTTLPLNFVYFPADRTFMFRWGAVLRIDGTPDDVLVRMWERGEQRVWEGEVARLVARRLCAAIRPGVDERVRLGIMERVGAAARPEGG